MARREHVYESACFKVEVDRGIDIVIFSRSADGTGWDEERVLRIFPTTHKDGPDQPVLTAISIEPLKAE